MNETLRQQIIDLVSSIAKEMLGNMQTPLVNNYPYHAHTGLDGSPQINIYDTLILPDRGVPFRNGPFQYNMYISGSQTSGGNPVLIIEPSSNLSDNGDAQFFIGKGFPFTGNVFNDIFLFTAGVALSTEITLSSSATDVTADTTFTIMPGVLGATVSDIVDSALLSFGPNSFGFQATGEFAFRLPDTSLPTAQEGMIAFNGGQFWGCRTAGIWEQFDLI